MLKPVSKLATCQELALSIAENAQTKEKVPYDKRARNRSFEIGQRLLDLLPIRSKPLEAKYPGPYTIVDQIVSADYVIATLKKRHSKRLIFTWTETGVIFC